MYELPFGKGRKWANTNKLVDAIVGGWRVGGVHLYASGLPIGLGTTIGFPMFNGGNRPTVSTYEGWVANPADGKFDPFRDRYLQPASFFGTQPTDRFWNATRYNPKAR